MDSLREKVARTIYLAGPLSGEEERNADHLAAVFGDHSRPDYRHYGDGARRQADAAIRAVFDHLMEPSEGMVERGIKQVEDCTYAWTSAAACAPGHIWQAMLTKAREEAGL